ncbi:MAG: hypothetical protein ABI822_17550 [Bryobacteraceae bacterium]
MPSSIFVMGGFYLSAIRQEERELPAQVDLPARVSHQDGLPRAALVDASQEKA